VAGIRGGLFEVYKSTEAKSLDGWRLDGTNDEAVWRPLDFSVADAFGTEPYEGGFRATHLRLYKSSRFTHFLTQFLVAAS
jgi:hypothetical protein